MFEFRLWTIPSLVSYSDVFIMQFKEGRWLARYFKCRNGKFSEGKVEQSGLESLWSRISYNQVLTLPKQESLKPFLRKYSPDTTAVFESDGEYSVVNMTDGTRYRFELFSGKNFRAYEYHCPASYLKLFPNIEQFYRAYAILLFVQRHLLKSLEVC